MKYVTANELKRNGISVVNEALAEYGEAVISVRGKNKYVILDAETYQHLRECEVLAAWAEAQEDIQAGRYHTGTEKHLAELKEQIKAS